MSKTWTVDPWVSTSPDASNGDRTTVSSNVIRDARGAFYASQLGFARAIEPDFLTLPSPGVDFPFTVFQPNYLNRETRLRSYHKIIQENLTFGSGIGPLTAPIDDTPRFIATSGTPQENSILNHQKRKRWKWSLAGEKNSFSMFPAVVPATSYSTISCDLLSEIQRHMLEPTIDGGLTWSDLWTKSEIQKFLNNRISRFFLETGVIQEPFSVGISPGISEYNYPPDLIQAKRLTFEENLSLYNGLVSFYRLQEVTGAPRIDSIGPNNLTDNNSVTQVTGKIGYGAGFDNSLSQRLNRTDATQVGLNPRLSDWAVSAWFYPVRTTSTTYYAIVSKLSNITFLGYSLFLREKSAETSLYGHPQTTFGGLPGGPGLQFIGQSFYNLNEWNHIVASYDRDSFCTMYLNGVRQFPIAGSTDNMSGFGDTTGDSNTDADFLIGAGWIFGGPPQSFFNGNIDAVGIWNRTLTDNEMLSLYNDGNGRELYLGAHDGPYVVLPRVDPFTEDNGNPDWESQTGTPASIIEEPRDPLSFQLSPTPDVGGSVEGIYVAEPDPIGDACVPLPIPNYLSWIIKYGVMSDMLRKEGEANDPQRAQYCEGRWKEGIQLTRMLLGFNDADQQENQ